jgi:mono/diheme cytochrome c family protein
MQERKRRAALACAAGLLQPPALPYPEAWCTRAPLPTPRWIAALSNPLAGDPEQSARGRALYHGKGFCAVCHGRDGRGFGPDVDRARLRGALPPDFTSDAWQRARSDGELYWTLLTGRPGTAMAPFVPSVLSEEEAWQVLLHVRAFAP